MSTVTQYLENAEPAQVEELNGLTEAQQEALLEVVGIAVYADGVAAVEELKVSLDLVREVPSFSDMSDDQLKILLARALVRLRRLVDPAQADAEYQRLAEQLGEPALREAALGLAAVICLSDGVVVETEHTLLKRLILAFGLPRERVVRTINKAKAFLADT